MAFNQTLGGQIEPGTATWRAAGAADRLAFYRRAGAVAEREKRAELARAIGANGRRMKARKHPRADGANGPVMTPHDANSRTARLLASRASATGLTLFWHAGIRKGQRKAWGVILGFHAAGQVRGAPVRDVRLSKRGINKVRAEMAKWWTAHATRQTRKARAEEEKAQKSIVARFKGYAKYFRKDGF